MALLAFHRLLIGTAIAFDVFFTVFCIRKYNRSGDAWELVMGFGSSLLTIALVLYLFHFNKKVRTIRQAQAASNRLCPKCMYDLKGSLESDAAACPECGHEITPMFRQQASASGT